MEGQGGGLGRRGVRVSPISKACGAVITEPGVREAASELLDPGWVKLTARTSLIPGVMLGDINLVRARDEGRFSRHTAGIMKSPWPEKVCPDHFPHKSSCFSEEG